MHDFVRRMTIAGLLTAWACAASAAPSGEAVVAKSIEALGGAEKIAAIESFHVTGAYVIEAPPIEGTIELFFARPNKLRMKVVLPNLGVIERGYDGEVGWAIQGGQAQILEGDGLAHLLTQAMRGFSLLPSVAMFESIEHQGVVEFEGRACHKVALVAKETERAYVEYFDVETGLLAGREEQVPGPQGTIDLLGIVSGVRAFGDVQIPTVWAHRAGPQKWKGVYETFEVNEVDMTVFELPEKVRAKLAEAEDAGDGEG